MVRLALRPSLVPLLLLLALTSANAVVPAPPRAANPSLAVDPSNREESKNFYRSQYLMTSVPAISWSGNLSTCDPGTTSPEFRSKVLQRINYFRAMAGVPSVAFDPDYCSKAQAAALIVASNGLYHYPSPDFRCYSEDGAEGASRSNLSGSRTGWDAVTGYIADWGGNSAAGHRRWLLYPQTQLMGTGDLLNVNALFVIDDNLWGTRPATREPYVAWPPPGYVPYVVVFDRWSFSHPGADFGSASVSMSRGGVSLPIVLERVVTGYGEPTLVWIPSDDGWVSAPISDIVYRVSVRNVLIGGSARNFDYQVTLFDPGDVPPVDVTRDPTSRISPEGDLRLRYRRRVH